MYMISLYGVSFKFSYQYAVIKINLEDVRSVTRNKVQTQRSMKSLPWIAKENEFYILGKAGGER